MTSITLDDVLFLRDVFDHAFGVCDSEGIGPSLADSTKAEEILDRLIVDLEQRRTASDSSQSIQS